ncbi:hypothetical protein Q1695_010084 [Nippostrongylus brasiliensis]|nr:hypothetical protein Q1695_010084 [Nippostrongylus brasiliensis]
MAVSFTLEQNLIFNKELADKVKNYLLGGDQEESHRFIKRTVSISSEDLDGPDPEEPAGVRDWEFAEQVQPTQKVPDESPLDWLSLCCLVTYNSLDYILLVNQQRFALLTRTASNEELEIRCLKELDYQLGFAKEDNITCGCLFGLGTHRVSEPLDCLIIALGMSNGHVVFFTERGTLLFFEQFSESDILWVTFDQTEDAQQLTIVTAVDFFAVDPISLHSTLLKAKTAIAKGEKTAEQLAKTLEVDVDRLRPEKVKNGIRHVLFTGTHQQSAFEQYATASMASYNETISAAEPPMYSTYLYTSDRVFSTFAWTSEADRKKIWSDAIKYGKSFVPSFGIRDMLGISTKPRKKTAVAQTSHVVTTRATLDDARLAMEAVLDVSRGLIAVVDHVARVLLIDVANRQIVRVWKGYREASVAWVNSSEGNQTALFLAIFARRRALLEIWNVLSGVRVGAVHVDPAGVLLDGGMQSVLCGSHNSELRHDAFFADSQGRFYRLVVPFRLSMLRVTSQDQHDQLLLSKFSSSPSLDSFMDIYGLLRMLKSKRELILMMLPLISDPSKLEKLLDNIPKSDAAGPVEELLAFVRRQLNVYCRLIKYGKQPKAVNGELHESHFNAEVQEIINRHCSYGESDQRPLMNIGEFLAFVDCRSTSGALWERNYPDVDMLRFGEFVFDRILQGQVDVETLIDSVLGYLPFSLEDFCDLICFMFIRSNLKMGAIGFSNLCEFIAHVEDRHPGSLEKCERAALDSTNLSRGLLLFAACCLVRKRLQNKSAVATEEPMETDDNEENSLLNGDDWEPVDPTTEHADCTILAMHAAFLTSKLKQPMPFSKIVTCARAFFREQIASLAARERWQPDELMEKLLWNEDLKELHSLLPNSLQESLLCCDIAWELMSLWFKGSSEHFDNFELALKYLEQVNDSRLRHGVVVLMWQNFILERFKAAVLLIEKTGRGPKEREARQHLQMPEIRIVEFLSRCHDLLKMLMNDVRDSPPPSHVQQDHLIEIAQLHPPASLQISGASRDSLVELAIRQPLVNYHLVLHHYHLAVAAAIQLSSGIRSHILRNLFCPIGQRAFFHPLDSHPLIPLDRVDDAVVERRHQFLAKVAEQGTETDRTLAKVLSCEWNLTVDTIQITQVLCYLRAGDDRAASREMPEIGQTDRLLQTMTRILAARVLRLVEEEKTVLTGSHLSFLNTVAGEENVRVDWPDSNWKDSLQSFGRILSGLHVPPQYAASFIRISGITAQYWGINIMD